MLNQNYSLAAPLLLAVLTLAYAVSARDRRLIPHASVAGFLQWSMGLLALGSANLWFLHLSDPWAPYATVFFGLGAVTVFGAGLVWRCKPLRVVGLLGLGLCLPRVFLVDIHSNFYRIAAFAGVGIVLLLVGFLYHRFRNVINGVEAAPNSEN